MTDWEIVREIVRTVLVMSVTGGVVALLLFAVKPLIKNRIPKTAQYYLWMLVLVALLIPFSTFISVPVNTPITSVKEVIDDNVKTTQEWYEERAQTQYNLPFDDLEAEEQVDVIFQDSKWWMNSTLLTVPIVCGITTFLIAVFNYLVYINKLWRRRLSTNKNETALLHGLNNGKRKPRLYRNPLAPTPMLVGIFRPMIYLPDNEYTEVQLHNILLHELTHLRRRDIIVKWIATFAVHIHWFNPIVYFVRHEIDRACELACDEAVIKNLDNNGKQSYGDTLIAVAADKKLPKTVLSTTMCEEKKALKERLGSIMKHKRFSVLAIGGSCVLVAAVLCGTIVLGASSIEKATAPVVALYAESRGARVQLTADVNTGIVKLPASVQVQAEYRDNTGDSGIRTYALPFGADEASQTRLLGGAGRDAWGSSEVSNTVSWDVAEEYPDGFDGYVWAVVTDSAGVERSSERLRVLYDPANVLTEKEFTLPVSFYTYSGNPLDIIDEELVENESGQISLPDTVVVEIEVPAGVIDYQLCCKPDDGDPLSLRSVLMSSSNTGPNMTPDIRSPDYLVWDVYEYFPNGFTGEIYAVATAYEGEGFAEAVPVVYAPNN